MAKKESPTVAILGGKNKRKTKTKPKEDYIAVVVKEIEGLKVEEVLNTARELADVAERDNFKLGGLLDRIHDEELYKSAGYEQFEDYVFDTFGFRRSKGLHLIQIYNVLVELEIPWEQARDVQWCKLRLLAKAGVMSKKNCEKWLEVARTKSVTELADLIRRVLEKKNGSDSPSETQTSETKTMSFKVHEDQIENIEDALEKAMEQSNTKAKAVGLYYVCTSFLHGGKVVVKKQSGLVESLRDLGPDDAVKTLAKALPEYHITAVEK